MGRKLTQKEFVERCNNNLDKNQDVSKSIYVSALSKVKVICKIHGEYESVPAKLMAGQGCFQCGRVSTGLKRRISVEDYFNRCREVHGNNYDYSEVNFTLIRDKIPIICKACNNKFVMQADAHARGQGCPLCNKGAGSRARRIPCEDVLNRIEGTYGNLLTVTGIEYKNGLAHITGKCEKHGCCFTKSLKLLMKANPCTSCQDEVNETTRKKYEKFFIEKSTLAHEGRYSYENLGYINRVTPVEIFCKLHNKTFIEKPSNHMAGGGHCPDCDPRGRKCHIYILAAEGITKIGITRKTPSARCKTINKESPFKFNVWKSYVFDTEEIPENVESRSLLYFRNLYSNPKLPFDGYTECFFDLLPEIADMKIQELIAQYNHN
jgi:hypothetical protein